MAHKKNLETALLAWVRTFPLNSKVESFADLSDGIVLSQMLKDFDPKYVPNDLEQSASPSKWINNKKALEAVWKSLLRFTSEHCTRLESFTLNTNVDLNAIAQQDDAQEMVKFLTIFLMAAVECPNKEQYITAITHELDESTKEEIAAIIKANQASPNPTDEVGSASLRTSATYLALEGKYAAEVSEHNKLKSRHETTIMQHEALKMRHEELKNLYTKADTERKALEASHQDGIQEHAIKSLQARIEENEILIASQEDQLENYRVSKEHLERDLSSLRMNVGRARELEDECKMLKIQNEALAKKANTVEHFQMKLESLNNTERDNKALRGRIDTLEANMKDYNRVYQQNERQKNTIMEYEKKFADYEVEITNLNAEFASWKKDSREKDLEIESLKATQAADEKFIQELQEQIKTSEPETHSPGSPTGGRRNLTLEEELNQAPDPTPNYLLEISRLKAENQLLKSGSAGNTNATLRIDLEESERKCQRLAENLRKLTEQQAITQKQLEAVLGTSSNEKYVSAVDEAMKQGPLKMLMVEFYRDNAIASTRDLARKATEELKATKAKLAETQMSLTAHYRDLLAAQADLAAVNQDELDALDDLKHTNDIITSSLTNDLQILRSRYKNLIIDYDQQRAHLVESLLDRENLRKDLEAARQRPKRTIDLILDGHEKNEKDDEEEKSKPALQSLKEQSERQQVMIQDPERRLKNAEEAGLQAQQAANEALIKHVARENSMIATAWYDLSSRLQSNHLVLQRRQDMPKSWLSRQRLMVNATSRR